MHITHVCAKLSRSNFGLRRVANITPPNILKTLYYSMFHSHLLYCPTILSCAPKASLNRISLLQKKAIRIITKSKSSAHTLPLFLANRILPFDKLILLGELVFMNSIANNYAPPSFSGIWQKKL